MAAAGVMRAARLLSPKWWVGPILEKELRVASRRRWSYWVRLLYLLGLISFIGLIWAAEGGRIPTGGSAAAYAYRMSEAGKLIVVALVWFQFLTTQLLAVILLSSAISDEISRRTLGVLMTTPIRAGQIVFGKLLSRLWQLLVLILLSLPVLAVVRVFGGVPWQYVLASLSITVCAALSTGAVSLAFSIGSRRSYAAILKTFAVGFALYALAPILTVLAMMKMRGFGSSDEVQGALCLGNPFLAMLHETLGMMMPFGGRLGLFSWWAHCLLMLAAAAVVLRLSVVRVRRAALAQAMGDKPGRRNARRRAQKGHLRGVATARANPSRMSEAAIVRYRPIRTGPVLWREMRAPLIGRRWKTAAALGVLGALLFGALYMLSANGFDDGDFHSMMVGFFFAVAALAAAVCGASGVAGEKEARTWPILLATPLSGGAILWGKAAGAIRRAAPAAAPAFLHALAFALVGFLNWVVLLHLAMIWAWMTGFLACTGLLFGLLFRRTTTAVVANVLLAIGLWAVLPFAAALASEATGVGFSASEALLVGNPVMEAAVVADGARAGYLSSRWRLIDRTYDWPLSRLDTDAIGAAVVILLVGAGHVLAAGCFVARKAFRLRKQH